MFDEIDRAYYTQRALEERERADASTDPSAVRTHLDLALAYENRVKAVAPEQRL